MSPLNGSTGAKVGPSLKSRPTPVGTPGALVHAVGHADERHPQRRAALAPPAPPAAAAPPPPPARAAGPSGAKPGSRRRSSVSSVWSSCVPGALEGGLSTMPTSKADSRPPSASIAGDQRVHRALVGRLQPAAQREHQQLAGQASGRTARAGAQHRAQPLARRRPPRRSTACPRRRSAGRLSSLAPAADGDRSSPAPGPAGPCARGSRRSPGCARWAIQLLAHASSGGAPFARVLQVGDVGRGRRGRRAQQVVQHEQPPLDRGGAGRVRGHGQEAAVGEDAAAAAVRRQRHPPHLPARRPRRARSAWPASAFRKV